MAALCCDRSAIYHRQDECSFVSLRDVERVLCVMRWFYKHRGTLFPRVDECMREKLRDEHQLQPRPAREMDQSDDENADSDLDDMFEVSRSNTHRPALAVTPKLFTHS